VPQPTILAARWHATCTRRLARRGAMMEPASGVLGYEDAACRLAQFEPDPEALGVEVTLEATGSGGDFVPWVTFEDAERELSWVIDELLHITPRSSNHG
jgi:hypothetical protein